MHILITSEDEETLKQAVEYSLLITDQAAITLLYAYQTDHERREILGTMDHLAEKIRLITDAAVQVKLQPGSTKDIILKESRAGTYDLLVFGSHLQASLSNLRPKRAARQIAKRICSPMLIVFPHDKQLKKILVCIGGTESDQIVLQQAGKLAIHTGAGCSILHVMSQIPLRANAELEDLERDARSLIEHDSKEGDYLQEAVEKLITMGLDRQACSLQVRHGLTVEEIIQESNQGEYDLIVIGGLEVSPEKSWHELRELVQEDLADRVLAESSTSVLIARRAEEHRNWSEM